MTIRCFCLIFLAFQISVSRAQSTFEITSSNTTEEIDQAIEYATDLWSTYLNSEIPIKLNVNYSNLTGAGPLAFCIGNGERNFTNSPLENVWYPSCLANSLAVTELNPGEFDIDVVVNSFVNYYFGTDGNPGSGQFDFVTIFLHEIVHGLGGLSITDIDSGEGSFGMVTEEDIFPLTTSWPFPEFEGQPSIWDTFLIDGEAQFLINQNVYVNPSVALGDAITSNDVWFSGPLATIVNDNEYPKIYAPSTFAFGSSIHHFDESSFPTSSGNGLFTPFASSGEVNHDPGPMLLAALADIGWSINADVGVEELFGNSFEVYPNPANQYVNIKMRGSNDFVSVLNLDGKEVTKFKQGANSISELSAGIYLLRLENEKGAEIKRLVVY